MLPTATLQTLDNGLKLVLVPDDHVESVCFGLFVASGSRHESAGDAGISHFIEHMLFKGTATRTALEISQAIEGRGGNFNAWTSEEGTSFFARLPGDFLAAGVDIIADMFSNAAIPDAEFARERMVILEEMKMYDDEPDSVASENLSRSLFPGNPVGLPIVGTEKTLMAMTPARLRDYMRKAYVPSATTAVVAGRFDAKEAVRLVERALGELGGGPPPSFERMNARTRPVREVRAQRDIQQTQLALGYRTFGVRAPVRKRSAASVFDGLMGRSMSSRLFQSVREKRGLSYDIRSQLQLFDETGGWAVTAGVDSARAGKALEAIDRELARIRAKRPSAPELRRTKEYLTGNFRLGLEQVMSRMFYFGSCVQTFGRVIQPDQVVADIAAVTADDVLSVANEILDEKNRAVSWVTPKSAKRQA
ncbi:MAG: insulinase family protein [Kiritimatiellae bacterium]|nr:insulinase family protein [Kiritimatiellia bacterium]